MVIQRERNIGQFERVLGDGKTPQERGLQLSLEIK